MATPCNEIYCDNCYFQYNAKSHLIRHLQSHISNAFLCDQCPANLISYESLWNHIARLHMPSKEVFICFVCSYESLTKGALMKHIRRQHQCKEGCLCRFCTAIPEKFICSICWMESLRKGHIERHLKRAHPITQKECLQCDGCSSKFYSRNGFLQHHCKLFQRETFKCNICDYKGMHKVSLSSHINLIHKKKRKIRIYCVCEDCRENFASKCALRRHMLGMHSSASDRMYCEDCRFSTGVGHFLTFHWKHTHGKRKKQVEVFKSEHCSYQTTSRGQLLAHFFSHRTGKKLRSVCYPLSINSTRISTKNQAWRNKEAALERGSKGENKNVTPSCKPSKQRKQKGD